MLLKNDRTPIECAQYVIKKVDEWIEIGLPAIYAFKVVSHLFAVEEYKVEQLWIENKVGYKQ